MPVPKDANRILRDNTKKERTSKCDRESLHLDLGNLLTPNGLVHRLNRHGRGRGRREDQAQLACDIDDEELAERRSEEEAEISTDGSQSNNSPVVLLGRAKQIQLI